jgi:hypothetical protein
MTYTHFAPTPNRHTPCYDAGTLRAYLDGELPAETAAEAEAHIRACSACQARLAELGALDAQIAAALPSVPAHLPSPEDGWAVIQPQLSTPPTGHIPTIATRLPARPAFRIAAVAAAVLLVVLLVPPVQAAVGQLLHIFRTQSVVYVSVSPQRLQQLANLQLNQSALFLTPPTQVGSAPTVTPATSTRQASSLAGFTIGTPHVFPSTPTGTDLEVLSQSTYQLQVNVRTLRQALAALGVTDVTIPDSLGAQPITIQLPPVVRQQYQGNDYTLALIEGTSPTVNLPAGVDLAQLGKAALEVYGLTPQQADRLSQTIDWSSTLVFPFPLGITGIQQVDVNGAQGVLLNTEGLDGLLPGTGHAQQQAPGSAQGGQQGQQSPHSSSPAGGDWSLVLYWQRGAHFYILEGAGLGTTAFIQAAASVK